MKTESDSNLLQSFIRDANGRAFEELVGRDALMVQGVALRRIGDPAEASLSPQDGPFHDWPDFPQREDRRAGIGIFSHPNNNPPKNETRTPPDSGGRVRRFRR